MTQTKLIITAASIFTVLLLIGLINFLRLTSTNKALNTLLTETAAVRQTLQEIKDRPNQNDEVAGALANLREELVRYRADASVSKNQVLGQTTTGDPYANLSLSLDQALAVLEKQLNPTPTPTTAKQIKLKPGWQSIDAFEQPRASSKIIGSLKADQSYTPLANQTGWYQINLDDGQPAWIQSQFVYEIN